MPNKIRFRLAPSPTGFLHLGNLRTALFGYLLAKKMQGDFVLRVEDTDQKREVAGATNSLIAVLQWLGLDFDEGPHLGGAYGPYIQSQRLAIYKQYADELLTQGGAYHCFCSAERLEKMRADQADKKEPPRYDRACRSLSPVDIESRVAAGDSFVIRQALPLTGETKVFDELRGEIVFKNTDLEDHVLIKSDGVPTYQFASVVDDHLMEISHVTRGEEWLPSFPKNVLLYQAFGWETPHFIHLPLILNKGGGKLSKRQGDVFVEDYRNKGYLPEALLNFCALLGWHPKDDKEIFSLEELKQVFDVSGLGASPAVFDQEKLDWFNGHYIRQKSVEELTELCLPYLIAENNKQQAINNQTIQTIFGVEAELDYIKKIVALEQERLKTLSEIKDKVAYFFQEPEYESDLLIWKNLTSEQVKNNLSELQDKIAALSDFAKIETEILDWIKIEGKKNGDYLWPLRVALTGLKASPGPFEIAGVLGRAKTLERLTVGIKLLK